MNGILLVDKPLNWTSFDVVAKVRSILKSNLGRKVKVGHAGTLDPLATGLLIILIGDACRQADQFLKLDKSYDAKVKLGATSTTDDGEGEIKPGSTIQPNIDQIEAILHTFVGEQAQTPPQFSAIKVGGRRAYKAARAGEKVHLEPRTIKIYKCSLKLYNYPDLQIETSVSSGTYIRSLARDIGEKLGCGAYLSGLRRTQIGNYKVDAAINLDSINMQVIESNQKAVHIS